jgi:hypothetical protein
MVPRLDECDVRFGPLCDAGGRRARRPVGTETTGRHEEPVGWRAIGFE